MADEKIFTVPFRKVFQGTRKKRAKRATTLVRNFLKKHMKSEDVKIGKSINEKIWERGIQKPPRRVRIHAIKENDIVYAELIGVDIKTPSKDVLKKKADKKKEKKEKIKEERKERKKKSIQEEIEDETGKKVKLDVDSKEEIKEKISEIPEEKKLKADKELQQAKRSENQKTTGKA